MISVLQPSVPGGGEPFATGRGGTEYLLSARNALDGSDDLRLFAITDTGRIGTSPRRLRGIFADIAAEPYRPTVAETEPDVVGPYCRSQGVTFAPRLAGGYNAFSADIVLAGGRLLGALATGANAPEASRNAIAYFVLQPRLGANALSARLLRQGYVVAPGDGSLAYPSLAMANPQEGVLAMSLTGVRRRAARGFPSAGVMRFSGSGPVGPIIVSGTGRAAEDGFSGCAAPGPGGIARWGDYGAATLDRSTGLLYAANEYIPDPREFPPGPTANWGTFITQVAPQPFFRGPSSP